MIRSLLLAFAVTLASIAPATAQTLTTIRVGTLPSEVSGEIFYGIDQGAFKKAGLDVQIVMLPNGGAIASALAGGAIDIGLSDVMSMVNAHAHGVPIVYLAPGLVNAVNAPTFAVIVAANSPIREAKDIKGVMAVSGLNNIAQIATQAWIDRNGGDSKLVKFIEMPFPAMLPALANGTIQASSANEPWLTAATDRGDRVLFEGVNPIASAFMLGGWATTQAWVHDNAPAAARFIGAMREIATWANAHHDESAPILAKYAKLPIETIRHMRRGDFAVRFDPALIQPVIDAALKYGAIATPFRASEIIFGAS
jgi:ABC-type nitrate/sulfonate/bicarbonate transport system substrate-binding protein